MSLRRDLVRYYRWLRHYGLNDSHSGNASVREGDRFWVTPTGACADTLSVDDLVACELSGDPGPGASLDAPLHQAVYRYNAEAGAMLHSHCPHAVALTLGGKDFEPLDFEGVYYFGRVPVIAMEHAHYVQEAPERVAQTLKDHPVAIVRGHGVYAAAKDLNLAYKWTCSLELSARTAWLARVAGTCPRG
jgi:L-fuculose-phosphate aldolase